MTLTRLLLSVWALITVTVCVSSLTVLPDPQNPDGYIVYRHELQEHEADITADPLYALWAQALTTRPNSVVEAITPANPSNPDNVKRAERLFPKEDWDFLASMSADEYTYTGYLRAIGKFPAFCGDYTDGRDADAICKKSIILAFAHYAQETGAHTPSDPRPEWRQALYFVREIGYNEGDLGYNSGCGVEDWQNAKWPCYEGQGYFGRGSKQLSYHYNYGPFSEAMFGNASVLLSQPRDVAETWLNLASSIWFFLTPQPPKPAMLHVIDRTWVPSQKEIEANIGYGFGTTINIINGGLECGPGTENHMQPKNRVQYWEAMVQHFNIHVESDEVSTCFQQTPYGSLNLDNENDVKFTQWERDWGWYPDRPGNYPFQCMLVGYATAYSALVENDYEKCVANHYNSHVDWPAVRVVDAPGQPTTTPPPPSTTTPGTPSPTTTPSPSTTTPSTTTPSTTTPSTTTPSTPTPSTTTPTPSTTTPTPSTTTKAPSTTPTPSTTTPSSTTPPPQNGDFIQWVPGETLVDNGDKVTYLGKCFIAKNNPGVWESPSVSNWFWTQISCDICEKIQWIPGETLVDNGDKVTYLDKCFIAKNNPGVWESPSISNWFWTQISCDTCGTTLAPGRYILWAPGSTSVENGDEVKYIEKCFRAKNNPGVWETPTHSGYFWDEIDCVE